MAATPSAQQRRLLTQLSRAYYVEGRSKVQIAEDFDLSRFQVARLLQEAVETGVVTISIESGATEADERGRALATDLGVREVIVIDDAHDDTAVAMGRAALGYLDRHARPGQRLGIAWSRTLDAAAAYAPALPRGTVVQIAGALQLVDNPPSQNLFTRLGQDPAIHVIRLYAPLLVSAPETATDLIALPEIASAQRAADDLDIAVVSVGAWREGLSSVWQKCRPAEREAARAAGAVAETSGRLIAHDGTPVLTIDDRVIAVTLGQLRRAGTTVGVAYGSERAAAVRAAAAAGILDVVIMDAALADALVASDDTSQEVLT
ncbi:DNA-binding transcriptional regulator [Leucobacter sp. Psy1]|uniref:sugar-binding domain-containing protein n=1 Tax=Leucobacter sp. Psy1 TaxID=2875729 RepID=UPI001CD4B3A4|nr:sugar-binding domain-containing protein [Leucobacter sp. Psy1]UBH05188.1 DNA-binding transcriptional regulator [Leucobacter sp. Psy1]